MAAVCPVAGTTTSVLPPHHPALNYDEPEAVCPVTNAKTGDHGKDVIHTHPDASNVPSSDNEAMDATSCPALKGANASSSVTDATCPVVGPVRSVLPPQHPAITEADAGSVCPATKATLEHHKGKLHQHPAVPKSADAAACPVVGGSVA